jgi:hypothetical protein
LPHKLSPLTPSYTIIYQPVEFAVLFLRRRRGCLEADIWAYNCPSDLLGDVGVVRVLVLSRWSQNDATK